MWLDFNSRVIQPEYYNFVLRKTGLTPNQAENTCLLLDRNTYGESFASVSDTNVVNTEYNNYVGAYNRQVNNTLSKNNPQGVEINTTGYDGNRGHYARWDAANAECLIRVAAYNKDNLITNKWLGIGDDTPAEVWQKAGSTFTCNKDLFDFSLMNQTKSAALIGVPAGTVLGASIGAAAGAGAYNKKADDYDGYACDNKEYRDRLAEYFRKNMKAASGIRQYFDGNVASTDLYEIDETECQRIQKLWDIMADYDAAIQMCRNLAGTNATQVFSFQPSGSSQVLSSTEYQNQYGEYVCEVTKDCGSGSSFKVSGNAQNIVEECSYVSLLKGMDRGSIFCKNAPSNCVNATQIQSELSNLRSLLSGVEPLMSKSTAKLSKGKEIGKGAAIGAVTGASAGGLATAITALVEKNNISCKVGDGLNSVSLGKSHTIDSLKDFYVKWNLRLPDTVAPTSVVSDVASWQQACSQFNSRLMDCPYVQVNLQTPGSSVYQLVSAACVISGSVCIPNASVMNSHLITPVPVVNVVVNQNTHVQ
ncbi:MAG: glycine zipper family protein [Alphaproteobacteria bacterium]|nr:glycine zipper family protein [Alphaproteobacteria bacterium]